jgi:peroxisome-assembly ATPase
MPGPQAARSASTSTSLAITNPLVLYRTLIATKRLQPDPAQHRLALQLQKLYFRLKDYSPEVEYRRRLERVTRGLARDDGSSNHGAKQRSHEQTPSSGFLASLLGPKATADMKALTPSTPMHDTALAIDSPQGMLLYGGVGRGKSMLLDLLFNALPSDRKRRWHFNTFMLDVFRRLELERLARSRASGYGMEHEHVVLSLARDTVETSPVLFLDEFQMPDRASSRLVNGFLTGFFGLGGVLVASSNRMPEELSRGQGVSFRDPYWGGRQGRWGRGGWVGWFGGSSEPGRPPDENERFVEVLKARCEIWEMEGAKDWRREEYDEIFGVSDPSLDEALGDQGLVTNEELRLSASPDATTPDSPTSSDSPPHYHLTSLAPSSLPADIATLNPTGTWSPLDLKVFGRTVTLSTTFFEPNSMSSPGGILLTSFPALCGKHLGPADYVSIVARFHSIILTEIPVLTATTKNEARRLIWLIDAMYEAGCRLTVSAAAPIDRLFFPETRSRVGTREESSPSADPQSDSIESEAFSEMYQDSTAPFRPNISSYEAGSSTSVQSEWRSADPTYAPQSQLWARNAARRNVLADEDEDFGPTYGNGRAVQGRSASQEELQGVLERQGLAQLDSTSSGGLDILGAGPDFTDTRVLVGEDERFAYQRARSRLWEMCGRRWWRERQQRPVEEWWRPEGGSGRFWEGLDLAGSNADVVRQVTAEINSAEGATEASQPGISREGSHDGRRQKGGSGDSLFRHGASPYRTSEEPPPKFGWQHAWGMVSWGRKAGEWGKGVEGKKERSSAEQPQRGNEGKD